MLPLRATPVRKAPVIVLEEANRAHTIETAASTYSELEASPAPVTWGSESTSASPSPASGASHHSFHPIRKTFARSVAPTTKAVKHSAQASTIASPPASGTQLLSASTRESSSPPAPPSPLCGIIDFYRGSSPSPHRPTQYAGGDPRESEQAELKSAAGSRAGPESPSLSSSRASEMFCRRPAPARSYMEDLLAMTDEDGNGALPQVETAPAMRDSSGVGHDSTSPSPRVIGLALDNSPVVPEMWEETSSSAPTSSTGVSDGFEKAEESQLRHRSVSVARIHFSSASPNSPLPAQLTASPMKWRRSVKGSPPSQANASDVPQRSAAMIQEKHASSPMADTKAAWSATMFATKARVGLNRNSRSGDFVHREAVERVLRFPADTTQEEVARIDYVDNEKDGKGAKIASAASQAAPVVSDDVAGHCSGQSRVQRSPYVAPPLSSRRLSGFPASPPVGTERHVMIPSCASSEASVRRGTWFDGLGGGLVSAPRETRTDSASPSVHRFLGCSAPYFPMNRWNVAPPLLRRVEEEVAASEPHQPPNCSAKKPSVRALLARLYPFPSASARRGAGSGIVSHDKRYASQMSQRTADAPPPRWNASTKIHCDPLTGGIELACASKRHSSVRHGGRSGSSDDYVSERPISSPRRRSRSAPAQAPLHTRASLLRLEATKARKAADAALHEEVASPPFHPTVAPHSARICRDKLRELKSSHVAGVAAGAAAAAPAPGTQLEQASRTEKSESAAKAWHGTSRQDIVGDAAVVADVSVSSSEEVDAVATARAKGPSCPLVATLPARQPPLPQVAELWGASSIDGARMYADAAALRERRQATQHRWLQERKPEEQPHMQMHPRRGASSCAARQPTEDLGCPKPPRPQVSAATDRISTSTQCDLLPSERTAGPEKMAAPGFDLQLGATPVSVGAEHAPLTAGLPMATHTALQRVDMYSTTPTDALKTRATSLERQHRVEDQLLELETGRRRRLGMLRHLASTRDSLTGELLFKPFTGR
ncbi:hypothetical protein, conserved [Leishmania donovani]|uniref:Uncharacterized protein n=1 Tax=Leishmania donovani TaxID=5661 RepID=E9BQV9_LEIDO|nr:hypothetical protein, conserved [Leishmania donovani]CBZ37638.1 hypothetical protein, conserved [Leishmania donovani]